jgi:FPC/CPF motif-containing protein YcgG
MTDPTADETASAALVTAHDHENVRQHLPNDVTPPPPLLAVKDDFAGSAEDRCNPLSADPVGSRLSSYAAFNGKTVTRPFAPEVPIDGELLEAHDQLRQQILGQFYPCTGAVSAFSQKSYRFGLYPELACDSAVRAVCHDLYCFFKEFPVVEDHFITFIAMFRGPSIQSEQHFEDLLWNQLQAMHAVDAKFFAWDKSVDSDPASRNFSYSIGGRSMYVIGMHPQASRLARTRPYPTMVFNLHQQFERLRARGKFDAMKQTIRSREMSFQGSINPMLTSFGEHSEARQYSGRAVPAEWSCPFHSRKNETK